MLDPITGEVIRSRKTTAVRYERDRPGSWSTSTSRRSDGSPTVAAGGPTAARWAPAQPRREARIGYDYVHSMVDDHSRLAYSEILPDEKGATCGGSSPAPPRTSPATASPPSSG